MSRIPTLMSSVPVVLEVNDRLSAMEGGEWKQQRGKITTSSYSPNGQNPRMRVDSGLGSTLCRPHSCQHCGVEVDKYGLHGLSCKKSEGRFYRHSTINGIIHRALSSAQVPSRLEPSGLSRSDGKRPDGVTMVPWKSGKLMIWDATCPDTLAQSYRSLATSGTGAVAEKAEEKKLAKYNCFASSHNIVPVAIETLGAIGPISLAFLKDPRD